MATEGYVTNAKGIVMQVRNVVSALLLFADNAKN
jgi:C4-type Zn-finger protein